MRHGSLFSGIGGFDLAADRCGFENLWQVEIDPYARQVLEKNFPGATRHDDVCAVGRHNLDPVDIMSGGFPCQDISTAGRGAGIEGARSGLWSEYRRIICELRPRYVVVENVSALLVRGMDRVLGGLAEIGYDAEWECMPAAAIGAPHRRDRVWIVAYPGRELRLEGQPEQKELLGEGPPKNFERLGYPRDWRKVGASLCRSDHGLPNRVERLKGIGNAIVPQIAEWIFNRIKTLDQN